MPNKVGRVRHECSGNRKYQRMERETPAATLPALITVIVRERETPAATLPALITVIVRVRETPAATLPALITVIVRVAFAEGKHLQLLALRCQERHQIIRLLHAMFVSGAKKRLGNRQHQSSILAACQGVCRLVQVLRLLLQPQLNLPRFLHLFRTPQQTVIKCTAVVSAFQSEAATMG